MHSFVAMFHCNLPVVSKEKISRENRERICVYDFVVVILILSLCCVVDE